MAVLKKGLYILIALAALSSCNLIISQAPGLYVLESGLGEFENRPTWFWEVYGPDIVPGFRYSFVAEENWIEVDAKTREFQPIEPLDTGEYTLFLQAKSISGLWSKTVSKTAIVATSEPFRPDDTYFIGTDGTDGVGQWALEMMGMPALWGHIKYLEQKGTARKEIVVAVVDTGYTLHPDLETNLLAQDGYDFIELNHDSGDGDDVRDDDATDVGDGSPPFEEHSWHGTGVAGAIAAVTNNGLGIAGIGLSKLKILPLRALGYTGGDTYDIAQSIRYAARLENDSLTVPSKTAKIINLSLGGGGSDAYFEEVLAAVTSMGIVVVASAGNSREYGAEEVDYPASSQYTIAAAATTYTNTIAPYSNPGVMVDIAAPGGRGLLDPWTDWVITLSPDPLEDQPLDPEDYMYAGTVGTSISCPHIAGILALLCTVDASMDLTMAKEVLKRSATDLGDPGWDRDFGHGLVNALAAFGEYKLLRDAGWTGLSSRSAVIKTPIPSAAPTGELSENSLIVRFVADGAAKSISTAGRLSAMGATPSGRGFGKDLVIKPDTGIDPAELRKILLEEPDVEAVFYNYKYVPK
jgi:hypothetical protein